jgi:hypothetical protein
VPGGNFGVTVTATGQCWVEVRNQGTGTVVWEGLMDAGQSQTFQADGPIAVELGAAYVATVTLGSTSVVMPAGHASPFWLTFAPA